MPIPKEWMSRDDTPFDFIVVGSGAGGAPLAARLVERGFSVLVIEMGSATLPRPPKAMVENTEVPLLHPETTEDPRHSLRFFVKHFSDSDEAGRDPKIQLGNPDYRGDHDEDEVGIFYPRAKGLGGCTIHNAMITICGPSEDWDEVAEATGDESWRGERMRAYFERVEKCHYAAPNLLQRFLARIGFDHEWSRSRHGYDGWLHTSLSDLRLLGREKGFLRVVLQAAAATTQNGADTISVWVSRLFRGRAISALDPNHWQTMRQSPAGLCQIPCAITDEGRRSTPRQRLLDVQQAHPRRLQILPDTLVLNVLFDDKRAEALDAGEVGMGDGTRVVGVEVLEQPNVYEACVDLAKPSAEWPREKRRIFCKREVILSGGAFNTPQLLMLSGIGPTKELKRHGIDVMQALDGVGQHLQDRYEVPVICKTTRRFNLLDGIRLTSLGPDAGTDEELKRWVAKKPTNLYSTNGGLIGLLHRSSVEDSVPDLFIFALAGRFAGYKVGWSKTSELAPADSGESAGAADHKRTVTWLILKARSRAQNGTVTLRDASPFRRPDINFRSFSDTDGQANAGTGIRPNADIEALHEGVGFIESILAVGKRKGQIDSVEFPYLENFGNDKRLWIRHTAWGHHACGTCRMGPASDAHSVVDSRFRVHHVRGLRVVDASVFRRIPGYFVVANVYMIAEKAADAISEDHRDGARETPAAPILRSGLATSARETYPRELEAIEATLVRTRRAEPTDGSTTNAPWLTCLSNGDEVTPGSDGDGVLPRNALGVALSGGGIRAAIFSLGVLQAMARKGWLQHVDYLSTVSGGGYIGSFLGRLYDQARHQDIPVNDATSQHARVAAVMCDSRSQPIDWLRRHANYLAPSGSGESLYNVAAYWRNLLTVYFILSVAAFAVLSLVNLAVYWHSSPSSYPSFLAFLQPFTPVSAAISSGFAGTRIGIVWAALTELSIWLALLPLAIAYWLVSQERHETFVKSVLLIVFSLGFGAMFGFDSPVVMAVAVVAILWVFAVWRQIRVAEGDNDPTSRFRLVLARNSLTKALGQWTAIACGLALFTAVDVVGQWLARESLDGHLTWRSLLSRIGMLGASLGVIAPTLRWVASSLISRANESSPAARTIAKFQIGTTTAAYVACLVVPLSILSAVSHVSYGLGAAFVLGASVAVGALLINILLGTRESLPVVNRSGPLAVYAARLARVFQGATNPKRFRHPDGDNVTHVIRGDDVPHCQYQPHEVGGPLHLINVALNETVDVASQRGVRDRRCENMAIGPAGVSIAKKWHSVWERSGWRPSAAEAHLGPPLKPISDGNQAHPFLSESGGSVRPESLNLREWIGISGAAVSPGLGRIASPALSLLVTVTNLRLGYWWDSGLSSWNRHQVPGKTRWSHRLQRTAYRLFRAQSLLLCEMFGRFGGPWTRRFYLSDGGVFENSGAYELLRRRVPYVVVVCAGQDRNHRGEDIAQLMRLTRIDFGAEFEAVDLSSLKIPAPVRTNLGAMADLLAKDSQSVPAKHACLYRVTYTAHDAVAGEVTQAQRDEVWNGRVMTWLLVIKLTMTGDEPLDLMNYRANHPDFPNETTLDQFFDESQWESYRKLGEHIGEKICG